MFKKLSLEYLKESIILKNHIIKIKKELKPKLKMKDPQSVWRICVLYRMYANLKQTYIFLKNRSEREN